MKTKSIWFLLLVLGSAHAVEMEHLRDRRYCEVFVHNNWFVFDVYNTIRFNDCPEEQWQSLSTTLLKQQTGSLYVGLNGPRNFIVDGVKAQLDNPKTVTFNGIKMQRVAQLHATWRDFIGLSSAYKTHMVMRNTTWFFDAGKPVYEIIDANGRVFVMQSYKIPKEQLSTLQVSLHLPEGWKFRSGILPTNSFITAIDNQAIIIQDSKSNTYQLADHDFLGSSN